MSKLITLLLLFYCFIQTIENGMHAPHTRSVLMRSFPASRVNRQVLLVEILLCHVLVFPVLGTSLKLLLLLWY